MVIAIYLRCSSKTQDTKAQRDQLESWAKGQSEPIQWFIDEACTGADTERPHWQAMLEEIRAGKISRAVCQAIDRCSRSVRDFLAFVDELRSRGGGFLSLREGLDPFTDMGRFVVAVQAGFAEMERGIRHERQRQGIASARKRGVQWEHRPKGGIGQRTKAAASKVQKLASRGHSVTDIAAATGLSRPTVYKLLAS
jgi:DNA invertase Pin-like site-specific DNA recombinase